MFRWAINEARISPIDTTENGVQGISRVKLKIHIGKCLQKSIPL